MLEVCVHYILLLHLRALQASLSNSIYPHLHWPSSTQAAWLPFLLATSLTALLEVYTKTIDNLSLPLYFCAFLKALEMHGTSENPSWRKIVEQFRKMRDPTSEATALSLHDRSTGHRHAEMARWKIVAGGTQDLDWKEGVSLTAACTSQMATIMYILYMYVYLTYFFHTNPVGW